MIYYYKTNIPFQSVRRNEYTTGKFNKWEDDFILSGALLTLLKKSWLNMGLIIHALSYYSIKKQKYAIDHLF